MRLCERCHAALPEGATIRRRFCAACQPLHHRAVVRRNHARVAAVRSDAEREHLRAYARAWYRATHRTPAPAGRQCAACPLPLPAGATRGRLFCANCVRIRRAQDSRRARERALTRTKVSGGSSTSVRSTRS